MDPVGSGWPFAYNRLVAASGTHLSGAAGNHNTGTSLIVPTTTTAIPTAVNPYGTPFLAPPTVGYDVFSSLFHPHAAAAAAVQAAGSVAASQVNLQGTSSSNHQQLLQNQQQSTQQNVQQQAFNYQNSSSSGSSSSSAVRLGANLPWSSTSGDAQVFSSNPSLATITRVNSNGCSGGSSPAIGSGQATAASSSSLNDNYNAQLRAHSLQQLNTHLANAAVMAMANKLNANRTTLAFQDNSSSPNTAAGSNNSDSSSYSSNSSVSTERGKVLQNHNYGNQSSRISSSPSASSSPAIPINQFENSRQMQQQQQHHQIQHPPAQQIQPSPTGYQSMWTNNSPLHNKFNSCEVAQQQQHQSQQQSQHTPQLQQLRRPPMHSPSPVGSAFTRQITQSPSPNSTQSSSGNNNNTTISHNNNSSNSPSQRVSSNQHQQQPKESPIVVPKRPSPMQLTTHSVPSPAYPMYNSPMNMATNSSSSSSQQQFSATNSTPMATGEAQQNQRQQQQQQQSVITKATGWTNGGQSQSQQQQQQNSQQNPSNGDSNRTVNRAPKKRRSVASEEVENNSWSSSQMQPQQQLASQNNQNRLQPLVTSPQSSSDTNSSSNSRSSSALSHNQQQQQEPLHQIHHNLHHNLQTQQQQQQSQQPQVQGHQTIVHSAFEVGGLSRSYLHQQQQQQQQKTNAQKHVDPMEMVRVEEERRRRAEMARSQVVVPDITEELDFLKKGTTTSPKKPNGKIQIISVSETTSKAGESTAIKAQPVGVPKKKKDEGFISSYLKFLQGDSTPLNPTTPPSNSNSSVVPKKRVAGTTTNQRRKQQPQQQETQQQQEVEESQSKRSKSEADDQGYVPNGGASSLFAYQQQQSLQTQQQMYHHQQQYMHPLAHYQSHSMSAAANGVNALTPVAGAPMATPQMLPQSAYNGSNATEATDGFNYFDFSFRPRW